MKILICYSKEIWGLAVVLLFVILIHILNKVIKFSINLWTNYLFKSQKYMRCCLVYISQKLFLDRLGVKVLNMKMDFFTTKIFTYYFIFLSLVFICRHDAKCFKCYNIFLYFGHWHLKYNRPEQVHRPIVHYIYLDNSQQSTLGERSSESSKWNNWITFV